MKKLQISATPQRETLTRGGNEVLRLTYPVITGETPAAAHTKALVAALITHASEQVASTAAAALSEAVRAGRLFDFKCHTYEIAVSAQAGQACLSVTLTATHKTGDTILAAGKLLTYWSRAETVQIKRPRRARAR